MELKTLYVSAAASLPSKPRSRLALAAQKVWRGHNSKSGVLILARAFVPARGGFSFVEQGVARGRLPLDESFKVKNAHRNYQDD
jgi:hypothetical protein